MTQMRTGLENLISQKSLQEKVKGNIAILCNTSSVTSQYQFIVDELLTIFGKRIVKLFGPQHGIISDVQDNMVESNHFEHPFYKLPVYSLYSETRIPTEEMLSGIDTFLIDLQDVGTRIYTYIWTLTHIMEACSKKDIKIVVLDRPNPLGGSVIEGNILKEDFSSFVGRYPLPVRHGLTIGEFGLYAKKYYEIDCNIEVIKLDNWSRDDYFNQTKFPWLNPSPNLPTFEGSLVFPGTVLFEGCNISEGRGTTRSLEVIGHPKIEPYSFKQKIQKKLKDCELTGFELRPIYFMPTFQKHAGKSCGGFHIHPTDFETFTPWKLGQFLMREIKNEIGNSFEWKKDPYEYEFDKPAIDLINGDDQIRKWIEQNGSWDELVKIESQNLDSYISKKESVHIYQK